MGLIDTAKDAAKLVQQIGNIPLFEKLVSIQQEAMSLIDENRNLKDEIRALKNQIEEQARLADISADLEYVEDGGFWIRKSERAAGKMIPYCPVCWRGGKGDLVPLNPLSGQGCYRCTVHQGAGHQTNAYRDRQRQQRPIVRGHRPGPWS